MSETTKMNNLILNGQHIDLSPDYQNIRNKPKINGVTVDGNKTLDDYGLATKQSVEDVSKKVDKLPYGMYYGQYDDVESLPNVDQLTGKGYAYVATTEPNIFYIYIYDGEGDPWQDSGNKFDAGTLESNLSSKSKTKAPTTKAVKEGIEAVDVTSARSSEDDNELTKVQKYNASANINDRAADVAPITNEVKALGYKVLNPALSFAEQITDVNTVYEIRYKFDLNNEISVEKECNTLVELSDTSSNKEENLTSVVVSIDGVDYKITDKIKLMGGNKITLSTTNAIILNENKDTILSQSIYRAENFEYVFLAVPTTETVTKILYSFIDTKYICNTPISVSEHTYIRLGENQYLLSIDNSQYKVVWNLDFQAYDVEGEFYIGMDSNDVASYTEISPIKLGENSILKFIGGTLVNGTLFGCGNSIEASYKIFENVKIEGIWNCKGNIGWWVKGCQWNELTIDTANAVDEHEQLQLALDSSFSEMNAFNTPIYITQTVLLRLPKKLTLGHAKLKTPLNQYYYGENNNCTIIFTDANISLLKVTPVSLGKSGSKSHQGAYIEGGIFDVSLVSTYTNNAIEVISDYGAVWGCNIINSLIVNKSSYECPNDGTYIRGVGVYVHPTKYYIANIHINATIKYFGIGVKSHADASVNWLSSLYIGGYMESCLTFGSFDEGALVEMTSIIQPRVFFNYSGKFLYPIVSCDNSALSFGGMVWDLSRKDASSGTNYYLVDLKGSSRLKLNGLIDLYFGKSGKYNRIKGNLFNIEGYSVPTSNVFNSKYYEEDSEFNFFSNLTDYGTIEVKHYDSNGTIKSSPTISNAEQAFIKRNHVNIKCEITLNENSVLEDGDYLDIILNPNKYGRVVKSSIYIVGNSDTYPFSAIEYIRKDTNSSFEVHETLNTVNGEPSHAFVFTEATITQANQFIFRLKNITDNKFILHRISGSSLQNQGSNTENIVYDDVDVRTTGIKLKSGEKRGNILSKYCLFPQDIVNTPLSTQKILFNIKKYNGNSFYYLQFFAGTTTLTYNYNALYKLSIFYRSNNDTKKITLEKIYGSFDYPLKIYETSDFFTVVAAPVSIPNVYSIRFQILNPDINSYIPSVSTITGTECSFSLVKNSGDSANRPTVTNDIGFKYFDTTIGKPIYWNGTAWVDGNGETVGLQVSDTSVLIGAAAGSATINVYHANALNISALNPDNTPATWLTVPSTVAVGTTTLTITAAANTASNPRGAKVIIEDGTDVVIVNIVQNYSTT